jgi:hypothetical protein
MVTLGGNVHPALAHARSAEAVKRVSRWNTLVLLWQPNRVHEAALDELVAQQQNPHSSQFREFLISASFAARFGASQTIHISTNLVRLPP